MNILIPMTGNNKLDGNEYIYPKPLIELNGKTMIERSLEFYQRSTKVSRIIAIVLAEEAREFGIDLVLRRLVGENVLRQIEIDKSTQGALCTSLLAIESIDNDEPLIVSNYDQIIEANLDDVISSFEKRGSDFGVISFDSVHPKWSFVRLDESGQITEAAEKRAISRHAIAGFYYFRKGSDFVEAAKRAIASGATHAGKYFISSALNQLILKGLRGDAYSISAGSYTNFYDASSIKSYLSNCSNSLKNAHDILSLTNQYIEAFNARDIDALEEIFSEKFELRDPYIKRIEGKVRALQFLKKFFSESKTVSFSAFCVGSSSSTTFIHFHLSVDGKSLRGVDVISWVDGLMTGLTAYMEEIVDEN